MTGLPHRPPVFQSSTNIIISKYQDKKFSLLKDIRDGTYVSLVGEVRKLWGNLTGTQMYLTDYTSNNLLFDYKSEDVRMEGREGDEHGYLANVQKSGWKGPFGKMTIQISLWPPHDSFVNAEVSEGDIVLVRNLHVAFKNQCLEGKLHTDRRFPQQVDVRKVLQSDPLVLAMKARQSEYEEHKLTAGNKKGGSHKAEKKKKRKERKERQARMQQEGGDDDTPDPAAGSIQEIGIPKKGKMNANSKLMMQVSRDFHNTNMILRSHSWERTPAIFDHSRILEYTLPPNSQCLGQRNHPPLHKSKSPFLRPRRRFPTHQRPRLRTLP